MPRRAHCPAASLPARPAPMILTSCLIVLGTPLPQAASTPPLSATPVAIDRGTVLRAIDTSRSPSHSSRAPPNERRSGSPAQLTAPPRPTTLSRYPARGTAPARINPQGIVPVPPTSNSSRRPRHIPPADRPTPQSGHETSG